MYTVLLVLYIIIVILMALVILIQEPKHGGLGGVFGGGGMENILGAREAPSFFVKLTAGFGAVFMILSLFLSYINQPQGGAKSAYQRALERAMKQQQATQQQPAPVQPSPAPQSEQNIPAPTNQGGQ